MRKLRRSYARGAIVLFALSAALGAAPLPTARAGPEASEPVVGSLDPGDSVFWDGEYVEHGDGCPPACFEYALRLGPGGARLRVALDVLLGEDVHAGRLNTGRAFDVEVVSPDGAVVHAGTTSEAEGYSLELFLCFEGKGCASGRDGYDEYGATVDRPSEGVWRVRVVPADVDRWAFRMRARLDDDHGDGPGRDLPGSGRLLPNLRPVPPSELTFAATAPSVGFVGPGGGGPTGDSCLPDERAALHDPDARCLRFSAGPENVGAGPFELRGTIADGDGSGQVRAHQRLYGPDGRRVVPDRPAGWFRFHETHAHWHYEGYLTYELFRVVGGGADLQDAGVGRKVGFCPRDERLGEWTAFTQARRWAWTDARFLEGEAALCLSPAAPLMGLTSGWGDVYEWVRPEQYVELAADARGQYVVRVTVDEEDRVLEEDETDNVGFAWIEIDGDDVAILERGLGAGPWDPGKVVVPTWTTPPSA